MRSWLWLLVVAGLLTGCRSLRPNAPPPDASRPVIKTEAELAAEREQRVRDGQVVPTTSPTLDIERPVHPAPRRLPPPPPPPNAVQGDILMVNDTALTVADILYPLREELAEVRRTRTPAGFREEARRLLRRLTQQEIGSLLIYKEASASLDENERKIVGREVDKQLENLAAREFGASAARFEAHLKENGLTKDQYRATLQRVMVVREYTREKLLPQIFVRRDELLSFYRQNLPRYTTDEARELLLIEAPFARFLPEGRTWERAPATERAQAKLRALRQVRDAQAALADQPFEEVAREFSLGSHAEAGGSWGLIGRPLQPPYEVVSKLIFEHEEGWTSAPVETETGWFIVRCGRVEAGGQRPFAEAQDEIRAEIRERRFNKLSMEYVLKLAENATVSSLDTFLTTAVARAEQLTRSAAIPE
jgi:parvulin-like peptidyl-prolyl isomerase